MCVLNDQLPERKREMQAREERKGRQMERKRKRKGRSGGGKKLKAVTVTRFNQIQL